MKKRGYIFGAVCCMIAVALFLGIITQAGKAAAPWKIPKRDIVVPQDEAVIHAFIGEIVRLSGSGPGAAVKITAQTKGPVKIVAVNNVRQVGKGGMIVGVETKEFEVKLLKPGRAVVSIKVRNFIYDTEETEQYEIDIEQSPYS
jgi:hypothetical protein